MNSVSRHGAADWQRPMLSSRTRLHWLATLPDNWKLTTDNSMWLQTYDPLGNPFLSTALAALPVVVLLGAIGILQIRIHLAALFGLAVALGIAMFVYRMPASAAFASAGYGAAYGLLPIGWIILNLIFLVPADRQERFLQRASAAAGCVCSRQAGPADSNRFLVRGLFRRRGRIRHARGHYGGDLDAVGLQAPASVGPDADCQHGAGRVRRFGHADHCVVRRHRDRSVAPVGDDRSATAVFFADRSVLGRVGIRGFTRRATDLACRADCRSRVCGAPVSGIQLPRPVAGRCGRSDSVDAGPGGIAQVLAAAASGR